MADLLSGKTAVVTGSNRGIGRTIVETLAAHGAAVFACARKPDEAFEADMAELARSRGVAIRPVYFDFADKDGMTRAVREIRSEKRPIDILVNNAGVLSPYRRFLMTPTDDVRKLFEVDFFAQMDFTQLMARLMQRNQAGSIVYISSIASLDTFFSSYDYAACKAAVNAALRQQARELGESGIRVNGVAPGVIETDMIKDVDAESKQSLLPAIQLGRFGTRQDVANVVLFLASELSSYMTGQILRVDGGISPPRAYW